MGRTMMLDIANTPPASSGHPEAPRCAGCRTVMRHSCIEELESGGERHVYQCVTCGSTEDLEIAAG